MGDGHLNKCKCCTKLDATRHRNENLDRVRAYDRERGNLDHRVLARHEYEQTERGRAAMRRAKDKYEAENPIRKSANTAVGNALRDGRLKKLPCDVCGKTRVHGHHDDYSRPLFVRWLCPMHHKEWHKHNEPING